MGAGYLIANRNKRSVVLDLKSPEGSEAMRRLIASADVFVHNMRPAAVRRLGLSYDALSKENERLVYCAAYGFAEGGPYAGKPAYDDIIQAVSGIAALQKDDTGAPRYIRSVIADKTTALTVVYAVAMALFERERSGRGQAIEVPMFETLVSFLLPEHLGGRTFDPPLGPVGYERMLAPHRRPYATKDGWIAVLPYSKEQWQRFFALAQRPEMIKDPRVTDGATRSSNIAALYEMVSEAMPRRTTAEWLHALDEADVPCIRVNEPDALLDDPHLVEMAFFKHIEHPSEGTVVMPGIPVGFARTPGAIRRPAPRLGEHTEEVLREIGMG
jgi:crotonobetainyl-CoA:carnitine CoA-transferase CaiB-like acyl-CoA transferase